MTKRELIQLINAMMETMDEKTLHTVYYVILGLRKKLMIQTMKVIDLKISSKQNDKK